MEIENQQNNNNSDEDENENLTNINNNQRKDSNNRSSDNNSNLKILPLEIDNNRKRSSGSSEKCVDVDILEHNDKSLVSIQQVITNPNLNADKGDKFAWLYFYRDIPLELLKAIIIIIIGLYMITGIIGVIFFVKYRDENPFLFCFNFISRDYSQDNSKYEKMIFSSDLNSFCIIHFILLFLLIMILITLFLNKDNNGKSFLKDFSIFFPLILLFDIPIFIFGIFSSINGDKYWNSIIYIIFNLLGTLCSCKIYITTKRNKYKNLIRVINQGFLSGLLAAFELYSLMYNICYLSTWWTEKNIVKLEIIPGVIYFIFSILTIILYNDIFFSVTALIIQIGLLYIKKKDSLSVVIFNICVVFFSFISTIALILKQNKNVFNIVIEGESKKKK
jgi:hypothetical protein